MSEEFMVLGKQPYDVIAQRLHEIGDHEAAQYYEARIGDLASLEEGGLWPRAWLNTDHQYGFFAPSQSGSKRLRQIIAAGEMEADLSLQNQRINVYLDWLHAYEYPPPLISFGDNIHTILFTFEARNQVKEGEEHVALNQIYHARSGQDASVTGYPIFIGLNVGLQGIGFSCKTINVSNSNDKKLVDAINSQAMKLGLSLLTTAQPALTPFIRVAQGMTNALSQRNVGVQGFDLGLDFNTGPSGARLAMGSYVVVQVPRSGELDWDDWGYDTRTQTIVRTRLARGEKSHILPYNAIIFRVSKYQSKKVRKE